LVGKFLISIDGLFIEVYLLRLQPGFINQEAYVTVNQSDKKTFRVFLKVFIRYTEGVTVFKIAVLVTTFEPTHTLLRTSVCKAIRHRIAIGLLLQGVVSDCMGCIKCLLNITNI